MSRLGDAARDTAIGFVSQLGLDPVLIPERHGAGDGTFIERADVLHGLDFAIFLLSADDLGVASPVLFEIGVLLGTLGPGRVCFVVENKPARMPDLEGLVSHPLDGAGVWRLLLAREMRQAGLDVDLNRAM